MCHDFNKRILCQDRWTTSIIAICAYKRKYPLADILNSFNVRLYESRHRKDLFLSLSLIFNSYLFNCYDYVYEMISAIKLFLVQIENFELREENSF